MKVQPMPANTSAPVTPQTSGVTDAKTRAIQAWNSVGNQPAQEPVRNQNAITPEEMTVVRAPTRQPDASVEAEQAPAEPQTAPPATTPEEQALSKQYAQLVRQERALRQKAEQQEAAYKAREAALAAKEAELSTKDSTYQNDYIPKSQLKQNTLQLLAEQGISYEELTQQILNQGTIDPRVEANISRLEAQIRELKAANEASAKAAQDQQTQAYQAAVKQIETDAKKLVSNDPAYEAIKATGSVKDVVELITKTYDEDGVLLSVEEAASQVEEYLVDRLSKYTKIEKIQKRLGMTAQSSKPAPPTQTQVKQPQEQQQPTMKTLTNATSVGRKLSAKERALLAFKGELK